MNKWFGGYFDGKGSVILSWVNYKGRTYLQPKIEIRGKEHKLRRIIKEFGWKGKLKFHKYTEKHKKRLPTPSGEGEWKIEIRDFKGILEFIELIRPYTIFRKKQLDIMERTILNRKNSDFPME